MRYTCLTLITAGILVPMDSRNILTSSIRPHARVLIQSITSDARPPHFSDFNSQKVANDEFCQAGSTFITKTPPAVQAHSYLSQHVDFTRVAAEATRVFLQNLETVTRADDVRLADQIKNIWDRTIIEELTLIAKAVRGRTDEYKSSHDTVEKIMKKPSGEADKDPKEELPRAPGATKFSISAEQHALAAHLSATNPVIGYLAHSPEGWDKMKGNYLSAHEQLSALQEDLASLIENASNFMGAHVTTVTAGNGYSLKWGQGSRQGGLEDTLSEWSPAADKYASSPEGSAEATTDPFINGAQLGSAIMENLVSKGDFGSFINAEGSSQSEKMDRLTTTLNVLQIRRLGLADAKKSLEALLTAVKGLMDSTREKLIESLKKIANDLVDLKTRATAVYHDAQVFPGVAIVADDAAPDADAEHAVSLTMLVDFKNLKDAHAELGPRINMIVNVLRRLHGHLYAFVGAHLDAAGITDKVYDVEPGPDDLAGIKSALLTIPGLVETFLGPAALSEPSTLADGDSRAKDFQGKIRNAAVNSRQASECLLYGRVDSLLKKAATPGYIPDSAIADGAVASPQSDATLCANTHKAGGAIMKLNFPQLTPEELANAKAGTGAAARGSSEAVADGVSAAGTTSEDAPVAKDPTSAAVVGGAVGEAAA